MNERIYPIECVEREEGGSVGEGPGGGEGEKGEKIAKKNACRFTLHLFQYEFLAHSFNGNKNEEKDERPVKKGDEGVTFFAPIVSG